MWGIIMEDLLAKFYGNSESEGSADAPRPGESAAQPERDPQHNPQLEQRVSLVETQLLQIAKAQQAILARLDTMIGQHPSQPAPQQEPPPAPRQAWRPAWKEPRPEPQPEPQYEWPSVPTTSHPEPDESIGDGEGTPILWDPVNKTLHAMDDASEDDFVDHKPWEDPAQQERGRGSTNGPKRTCTICGRQFPMRKGHMARSTQHGPETLHCPKCYSEHQAKRKTQIVVSVVIVVVIGFILLVTTIAGVSRSKRANNTPHMDFPARPTAPTRHPNYPFPKRK